MLIMYARKYWVACFSALLLASCALAPPGYKYHNTTYRSPAAHPSQDIGYAYMPSINDQSLRMWTDIIETLLNELEYKYPSMSKVIYLPVHDHPNLFVNSYDFALRQELYKRGYTLAKQPEGFPHLYYDAYETYPQDSLDQDFDMADQAHATKHVTFMLNLAQRNVTQATISQDHIVPAFYTKVNTFEIPEDSNRSSSFMRNRLHITGESPYAPSTQPKARNQPQDATHVEPSKPVPPDGYIPYPKERF